MMQKDKQLLFKDLCARLLYEVKGIRIYKSEEVVTLNEIIPRCKMNPNEPIEIESIEYGQG